MFNSVRLTPISVFRSLLLECDPDRILVVVTYQDFPQEFTQWRRGEIKWYCGMTVRPQSELDVPLQACEETCLYQPFLALEFEPQACPPTKNACDREALY